jgi:hypothetical protein
MLVRDIIEWSGGRGRVQRVLPERDCFVVRRECDDDTPWEMGNVPFASMDGRVVGHADDWVPGDEAFFGEVKVMVCGRWNEFSPGYLVRRTDSENCFQCNIGDLTEEPRKLVARQPDGDWKFGDAVFHRGEKMTVCGTKLGAPGSLVCRSESTGHCILIPKDKLSGTQTHETYTDAAAYQAGRYSADKPNPGGTTSEGRWRVAQLETPEGYKVSIGVCGNLLRVRGPDIHGWEDVEMTYSGDGRAAPVLSLRAVEESEAADVEQRRRAMGIINTATASKLTEKKFKEVLEDVQRQVADALHYKARGGNELAKKMLTKPTCAQCGSNCSLDAFLSADKRLFCSENCAKTSGKYLTTCDICGGRGPVSAFGTELWCATCAKGLVVKGDSWLLIDSNEGTFEVKRGDWVRCGTCDELVKRGRVVLSEGEYAYYCSSCGQPAVDEAQGACDNCGAEEPEPGWRKFLGTATCADCEKEVSSGMAEFPSNIRYCRPCWENRVCDCGGRVARTPHEGWCKSRKL